LPDVIGALPTATLLGPLVSNRETPLAVVTSIVPTGLPTLLAYRQTWSWGSV